VASTTQEQTPGRLFPTPTVSSLDVIEVRRVIELHYLDLVVGRATENDFARMRARLEDMESATGHVTFKAAGDAFQLEVVRATRNPRLIAIYEMLSVARAKADWGAAEDRHPRLLNVRLRAPFNSTEFKRLLRRSMPGPHADRDGAPVRSS
jgi:DNA-binding FadR family transcriptional regulator